MKTRLVARTYSPECAARLRADGYSRPLSQILAGRGVSAKADMETALAGMVPPSVLPGAARAAHFSREAYLARQREALSGIIGA